MKPVFKGHPHMRRNTFSCGVYEIAAIKVHRLAVLPVEFPFLFKCSLVLVGGM